MQDQCSSNPFHALGLPVSFDIGTDTIERAYLMKLAQAHPDAGGESDSGNDAASLNQARLTLLDSEKRANALLSVLGGPSSSESNSLPEGFLMEMMTRREEIEDQIQAAGEESRSSWESWAVQERKSYAADAESLFSELNDPASETELAQIRVHLNAWRYIERLVEQLDPDYDPQAADFR